MSGAAHQMREVLRSAAEAYLHPDFNEANPPDIASAAYDTYSLQLTPEDSLKVERYALAAAAIHLLFAATIEGEGPDAHFVTLDKMPEKLSETPLADLDTGIRSTFQEQGNRLTETDTRFQYVLDKYLDLSDEDDQAAVIDEDIILSGGDLPENGVQLVGLTANTLHESPSTATLHSREKVMIAHSLIPIATGRATMHLDIFEEAPGWDEALAKPAVLSRRGTNFAIIHPDKSKFFTIPKELLSHITTIGPLLKCPAHQRLFGRRNTALELGLHATINLADQFSLYGEDR